MPRRKAERVPPSGRGANAFRARRLTAIIGRLDAAELALKSCRREQAQCIKRYGVAVKAVEKERKRYNRLLRESDPDLELQPPSDFSVEPLALSATLTEALKDHGESVSAMRDTARDHLKTWKRRKPKKVKRYL